MFFVKADRSSDRRVVLADRPADRSADRSVYVFFNTVSFFLDFGGSDRPVVLADRSEVCADW